MKSKVYPVFSLLLALLLGLTACQTGGASREVHKVDWVSSPAYLSEDLPLPVQTGDLIGCCTDGAYLYMLADEKTENQVRSVLCRVSLPDGTAEVLEKYQLPEVPEGAFLNRMGPMMGPDGTLWVYDTYSIIHYDLPDGFDPDTMDRSSYYTGRDDFHHLSQLDPATGKQKKLVDLSEALRALALEGFSASSSFAVDGQGNIYFSAAGSVAVNDSKGNHLFTLEANIPASFTASSTSGGTLALLPDGAVAVLTTLPGGKREVRTIDPDVRDWGDRRFALPVGVDHIYSGSGGFLFFYTQGSELFAWEPEGETARRLLDWGAVGLTGSTMCFAPLDGGKLAALTLQYTQAAGTEDFWYNGQLNLSMFSPIDRDPDVGKIKLTYGAIFADSKVRDRINRFNQSNDQYILTLRDYAGDGVDPDSLTPDAYTAAQDAAYLRLRGEIAAGNIPDIWDSSLNPDLNLYARRGYLEDLWPWIDGDTGLGGRDALMAHALECTSTDGKLYCAGPAFTLITLAARADLVGDRTGWTLEELLECFRKMPEGSRLMDPFWDGSYMLSILTQYDNSHWVDWVSGECHFDSQEFKDLLELCRQANEGSDPNYVFNRANSGLREGRYLFDQVFLNHPQDLLQYEVLFSQPEELADYEAYLNENNIFASLTDENGKYREQGAMASEVLQLAENIRKAGVMYGYPLGAGAVFGALEGGGRTAFMGYPSQDRSGSHIILSDLAVGMSSSCRHKEGAWAFIRQYLLPEGADPSGLGRSALNMDRANGFPINKAAFEEFIAPHWFTDANGDLILDAEGERIEEAEVLLPVLENRGEDTFAAAAVYELYADKERREQLMEVYNAASPSQHIGPELLNIIREQAGIYFAGDSTLEETAALIQRRATLYVNEMR